MKITDEIMRGDLLRRKSDGYIIRVEQITKNKIGYHTEACENKIHWIRTPGVEPIPLTPEILEKNGFEKVADEYGYMVYIYRENPVYISIDLLEEPVLGKKIVVHVQVFTNLNIPVESVQSTFIKHVHQLQHALRLCGIEKEIVI